MGATAVDVVVAVAGGAMVLLGVVVAFVVLPRYPSDRTPPAPAPAAAPTATVRSAPAQPAETGTGKASEPGTGLGTPVPVGPEPSVVTPPVGPVDPVAPRDVDRPPTSAATPAPDWLGTRALAPAGSGPVAPQDTPPELVDRRLISPDVLPPPTDDRVAPVVSAVPPDVLARSTWQPACPVAAADLRHVLVQHWGFDGRLHTGELLLHADAVDAVVEMFAAMHAERFPVEEVRVIRADELDAAPTGDGNVTSAFVCRPRVGGTAWSQHAYGRALDVNPFHNPYERGAGQDRVVIPELATAYTDRSRMLPGMLFADSGAVRAAQGAGWGWGGDYRRVKDWMHLSADGT